MSKLYTVHLPFISRAPSKIGLAGTVRKGNSSSIFAMTKTFQNWLPFGGSSIPNAKHIPTVWSDYRTEGDKYYDYLGISRQHLSSEYSGDLLALNEPRLPTQANKTPQEAVYLFNNIVKQYPKAKLYFPQFALDNPEECYYWYTQFYEQYEKIFGYPPKHEGIGIHVYTDTVEQTEYLVTKFQELLGDRNLKLIVSEFGVPWSQDELLQDDSEYSERLKELGIFDDYVSRLSTVNSEVRADKIMKYYISNRDIKHALYFMNAPDDWSNLFSPVWMQCGKYYEDFSGVGKSWIKHNR